MKKILLLDDSLDVIQVVEEVLVYEQYEVESVMEGAGFLSIIADFRPDLIIMDYRLSDGNGGELCQTLKAHPQYQHIPIIIFTAYVQPGLDLWSFGCDAVICKPFDLEYFLKTIQGLMSASTTMHKSDPLS
ncbi:PleD family two-component system response regulator [Mucilaginibacter sp. SG564]|uniref:response regulator n=1 Tax=Mucilaginibacter sp. SG564 TaxID=2587022 RepID=UPI001557BD2B|nr:response regulator [Mucilaginibacter sp. SG564]NOW97201.1 CheY-like chemotaxis protein [Mucilaginibacter sp. SG564]